jgi:hypothetical protein
VISGSSGRYAHCAPPVGTPLHCILPDSSFGVSHSIKVNVLHRLHVIDIVFSDLVYFVIVSEVLVFQKSLTFDSSIVS